MKFLLRLVAFAILALIAGGAWISYRLTQPYRHFSGAVYLDFARGTGTPGMADTLARNGVIESPWLFLAARALRRGARLQAGEYRFDKPESPLDVFGRIARGDIYFMELLVPEGYNMFDIAEAVGKLGTIPPAAFLAAAKDPSLIRDLDPAAPTLEGYLFPNKYRLLRRTTAHQLCRMMTDEFRKRWGDLNMHDLNMHDLNERDPNTGAANQSNVHDTVTLASLIEREAKRPEERPLIASVFANRLRIGMKLDCDPTTVYAALLENRYRGTIYRSDLASLSEWNTYRHAGLPPGPIANPGLSSIRAALHPAHSDYLYFVAKADGSGEHNFSESLARHETNVAQYHRASGR